MSKPKDFGENYSVSKGLRYKTYKLNYFHKGVTNGCISIHNRTGFLKCRINKILL